MEKKKRESRKRRDITEQINDLKKPGHFIMVGVGASAGGFKPLMELFRHIPADSGMAYAVILHLSPTHKSNLAELLQRETAMPVTQVHDAVKVEPNHIYVIPPSKNLMLEDGMIHLSEPEQVRGQRVPIDLFFRSLAEIYNNSAIAIVLSGAGADGTLGMRHIKEHGGLTIVQDPREAEQESMPRSAINSGVVDFVLPIAEIPEKLLSLRENAEQIVLPPPEAPASREKGADALGEVLALVRTRSGHDFSSYKRSTILRRIERRLQVNEVKDIPSYLTFLREHQEEVYALLRDMLISVTSFFRDREAFECLEHEVVPRLFDGKTALDQVRVWVTGCATGEEAYSMAILLCEHAARMSDPPKVQVFATDIDEGALARARNGVYPDTIAADVLPERLKQFFTREGDHYHVKKDLREVVLFAPHNILRDPPFSRLDLINCRNLLIYLTREIQERVQEIFHFALHREGFLFLGLSETAEGRPALFTPFDKKYRIYRRRATGININPIPLLPQAGRWEVKAPHTLMVQAAKSFSFADLHQQRLLEQHTPSSVLVNEDYDIVHISGHAGRYLHFADGEPTRNLLKVVHSSLRHELRATLFAARQQGRSESRYIRTNLDGDSQVINLIVEQVNEPESALSFLMVVFVEVKESPSDEASAPPLDGDGDSREMAVHQMDEELQKTRGQLRTIIEQYETSVEELKASNEELQAINEELRSASEELETSREELQSVNEELTTVNHELKEKMDEVSRVNSDLQNLMASTEIGTVFLDRSLQIKRYTPRVQEIFNIIAADIGRPVEHLTHKLEYNDLVSDAAQVIATLRAIEREVASSEGQWFIARLLPYRTVDDRIDGVVVTFVDITDRKLAERERERLLDELGRQRSLLDAIVRQMPAGVLIAEAPSGRMILGNEQVERIWKNPFVVGGSIEGSDHYRGFHADGRPYAPQEWPLVRSLQNGEVIVNEEIEFQRGDGTRGWMSVNSAPIYDTGSRIVAAVMAFYDISERRQLIKELEGEVNERRRVEAERRHIMRQLVTSPEEERRRISRELHDQLGQQLTVLKLELESLLAQSGFAALREQLERAQSIVQAIDKDLDFLVWELRPTALDDLGLAAALAKFVQEWGRHSNTPTEFHTTGMNEHRLPLESETMLYRIAQEALNNASKHAQASYVEVLLERRGEQVVLIVADNGTGFDANQAINEDTRNGMGLISMRERAAFVGGTLEIESQPGEGTTIYARVPFVEAGDQR